MPHHPAIMMAAKGGRVKKILAYPPSEFSTKLSRKDQEIIIMGLEKEVCESATAQFQAQYSRAAQFFTPFGVYLSCSI